MYFRMMFLRIFLGEEYYWWGGIVHIVFSETYKRAFQNYLRYGIALDRSFKIGVHSTPYYIWRTRGDASVRPSHAQNNGKIFSWSNPPSTGHPGDEYGCRCWAEPYNGDDVFARDRIDSVYPIETLIGLLSGAVVLRETVFVLLRRLRDVDAETLTESQVANLKRFDKKLPKDAQEIQILKASKGARIFRADVPARNIPGSFARYEKVIDAEGNTLSYTKTTFAPDGTIVHVKIK